jgi:large subunit ribosomal protein L9
VKIILREHVDHLGERGEIVTVANGYARNYLLPKGYAYEATPGNLKQLEHQHKRWVAKEANEVAAAEAVAARIAELGLSVTKKAGESGTLYGSVTNVELAELLAAKGVEIDRRKLVIEEPIKAVGTYEVPVRLHRKVTGTIKLEVVAEEGTETE